MAEVAIVASAFGAQAIWRDGHAAWSRPARRAGAQAFEVRRELMHDADAQPEALRALGTALAGEGLWRVWSTPDALYGEDGALDEAALCAAVAAGRALGARFVKLQLGGFAGDASAARLASLLEELGARTGDTVAASNGPRVVVENGQLEQGGKLDQFIGLFNALRDGGAPGVIGMTFDIGNWQWPGEPTLLAAAALAPYVEYIHCKAVVGEGARRFAAAPGDDDTLCRAALALLPTHVPRGIEFPFDPARVDAAAAHYVEWLAAA
ncbi:sugar phosphate isomerase/epimerase [Paraburkholderia sp. CNPSo 3274]|uniref:TIM barrel protein n=1 Tax=Paraburkholderia sp. CNPSo 3274 TaxID=2940932 RepID=UPI0020B8A4EC|nr:TIM barrel protein [Paraburkholderia sp. CNPSo 3274]MCP3708589.1 sugar phosphate isomerase/epimerase [Paraburkholderia sp. CNPSo 3274]